MISHVIVYGIDLLIAAVLIAWMAWPVKGRHE